MTTADALKVCGNQCFQNGDFVGAEKFYTQAIIKDPTNAAFFTNRALARTRMEQWKAVVEDCEKAIDLLPSSLKAYTYLGVALLHLNRPGESFSMSQRAYQLAISQRSPSISAIAASCLQAKKVKWEHAERERVLRESALLRVTCEAVMQGGGDDEEKVDRCRRLEDVFGRAEAVRLQKRTVPDYLIDNITFGVMWDPVITIHGHSYDRSTLIDHLKRSQTDPLTREPLKESDLRPNLALRAASEEFLKENGWAVDW
ncbi:hypothetical protein BZA05DRAFT_87935 [Tricharina praecox]|uniref:uncharacterized protein n=1 Tax=Tricharina praecox TaxID=43433 RepID=UPI002220769A|nr:uncharacterized protein BZA05DRAFT_87935 [Tricharina praecox]KAI5848826.1 hypothetical protein BZA05DRAFT_87935 [Tricharina praecox]